MQEVAQPASDSMPVRCGFAVGTGHCGTHLLFELLSAEPDAIAKHECNPINETFHRYCQWNRLPVDEFGFLMTKSEEMQNAQRLGKLFFEASSYLSLSVSSLYRRFSPRFILLIRDPVKVVNSLWVKGWYAKPSDKVVGELAVDYLGTDPIHHFLGRIVPRGEEYYRWKGLTRIGKIAWFWNTLNLQVVEQFKQLPQNHHLTLKLEELDFYTYRRIAEYLSLNSQMTQETFDRIFSSKPGASQSHYSLGQWSQLELEEFHNETAVGRTKFGYAADIKTI